MKQVRILGTRGIPATHSGFETFTESLAPYLATQGWDVTVYCQHDPGSESVQEDMDHWRGVRLSYINAAVTGPLGTIVFDWRCTLDALRYRSGVNLVLGYNTALFSLLYRLKGRRNLINMDGLEWRRGKWPWFVRAWFYVNERLGCWLGHHLIADHPEIARHLATRVRAEKITMIPYGAEAAADDRHTDNLQALGLEPRSYALLIARAEPENSILEIVRAFSARRRDCKLIVLGRYDAMRNDYHGQVYKAAGPDVRFLGAIFDQHVVGQLRAHARLYLHGHQVGGTNPSLVEAMAACCPVLAHDNPFNRWVAGIGAAYFSDQNTCQRQLDRLLDDADSLLKMSNSSRVRHEQDFTWDSVLPAYARLLERWCIKQESVDDRVSFPGGDH